MNVHILKEEIIKIDAFNETHIKEEQHGDEIYRVTYQVTLSPEGTINTCVVIGNEYIGNVNQTPSTPPSTPPQEVQTTDTPQITEKEEDTPLSSNIPKFITEDTSTTPTTPETQNEQEIPLSPEEFARKYHKPNKIEESQFIPTTEESQYIPPTEESLSSSPVQTPEVITPTEKTSNNTSHTLEMQELPQTGVNDVSGYALTGLGLSIILLILAKSKKQKK